MNEFKSSLFAWLTTGLIVVLALVLAAVFAEPFKELESFIGQHRIAYFWSTGIIMGLGLLLVIAGAICGLTSSGRPMTDAELDDLQGSGTSRYQKAWFRGKRVGRQAKVELSLSELKGMIRSGAWQRDPRAWFPILLIAGFLLLGLGMLGLFLALMPPWLNIVFAGFFLYALARSCWAFARS